MTVQKMLVASCAVLVLAVSASASVGAQDGGDLSAPVVGQSTLVATGEQPAVAYLEALWFDSGESGSCTGTLVEPEWVLTAAHCVMLEDGSHADQIDIVIGSVDIDADIFIGPRGPGVEVWRADGWVIHGDAATGPNKWFNDVAMVHLPGFSAIAPMELATNTALTEPATTNAILGARFYGFGLFQCQPGSCPDADLRLRRGESTIFDDDRVDLLFGNVGLSSKELARNIFLVPDLLTQGGGCFGDSGGPMAIFQDGVYKVAGVSSFISTATANFCDGIPDGSGNLLMLHAVGDLVGTDLGSWVRSIADASATCDGLPVTITGSNQADILVGTSATNVMHGRGGDDVILGFRGGDVLCGGKGADEIRGGKGADTIRGNSGKDDIRGNSGKDTLRGGGSGDTISGGKGADTIFGNSGKDTIKGNSGRDTIKGGTAGDTIDGGSAGDTISGNSGHDTIDGGSGNDTIGGGKGNDDIDGGTGTDTCTGGSGTDTLTSC